MEIGLLEPLLIAMMDIFTVYVGPLLHFTSFFYCISHTFLLHFTYYNLRLKDIALYVSITFHVIIAIYGSTVILV